MLEGFRKLLAAEGIETQAISRHQLYFHEDVPYTSHNSSMCTEMDVSKTLIAEIIDFASNYLACSCAEGSDPGLCVALTDVIPDSAKFIAYGRRAKNSLLTKDEAYQLAQEQNIHLSEHGGTGQGIVGALAAAALRFFGFDGRMKGKIEAGADGETMTATELLAKTGCSGIMAINGAEVHADEIVTLAEGKIKAVRMNWQSTIIVAPSGDGNTYTTLTKQQLKAY